MPNLPIQPLVSIDVVPLIVRGDRLSVILGQRQFEPYAGGLALPGVLLLPAERLAEAATRALASKVGITGENVVSLTGAGVFDNPDRDPRGPTLSIVHCAIIEAGTPLGSDLQQAVPLGELKALPFDHEAIIRRTAGVVLDALFVDQAITRALLGDSFSTADAILRIRELAAAAGREIPDTSNTGRNLATNKGLTKSTISAPVRGKGRPASSWVWSSPDS